MPASTNTIAGAITNTLRFILFLHLLSSKCCVTHSPLITNHSKLKTQNLEPSPQSSVLSPQSSYRWGSARAEVTLEEVEVLYVYDVISVEVGPVVIPRVPLRLAKAVLEDVEVLYVDDVVVVGVSHLH